MNTSRIDYSSLLLLVAVVLVLCPVGRSCATAEDSTRPTLYFFTNEACRPCKQVEPVLRELADRGYPITKVDTEQYPAWVREFRVQSTPTVVMVRGNTELSRQSGFVNAATVERWFNTAGFSPGNDRPERPATDVINKQDRESFIDSFDKKRKADTLAGDTSTMHKGTRTPANEIEELAMNATVRLRVEDPEGISFATGTVIHCHEGEWLVITCGHVFRDANGKGIITAEYGFDDGEPESAPGRLVSYDAGAKDIGLVAVKAGRDIVPFPLAAQGFDVNRGDGVFSIGCDHGQLPTIRRTRIKNKAAYGAAGKSKSKAEKVVKYDIYGRPVDGRSGGGLFSVDGKLLGVCNAASVDFDEGIYTGLGTIYWQIAQVNLDHLFKNKGSSAEAFVNNAPVLGTSPRRNPVRQAGAMKNASDDMLAQADRIPATFAANTRPLNRSNGNQLRQEDSANGVPWSRERDQASRPDRFADSRPFTDVGHIEPASQASSNDMEVIMIVRSKKDPTRAEAITLTDPSPKLLGYLEKLANRQTGAARIDMAQLRKQVMPSKNSR